MKITENAKRQFRKLYWEEHKTLPEIATMFGVTYPAIRMWFKKLGIPRRSHSEAQRLSNGTIGITRETIYDLYIKQGMSQAAVGKTLGFTQATTRYYLKQFNIPARNRGNSGSQNGMFGKTHSETALKKIREANFRQFSNPEMRLLFGETTAKQIVEGRTGKTHNKLEQAVAQLFDRGSIKYIWQYRLNRYVYDFFLPESNELAEANGTFWHADPRFYDHNNLSFAQKKNIVNDKNKMEYAINHGYQYRVIWEYDISDH